MDIALQVPELVHSHVLRSRINKVSGDNTVNWQGQFTMVGKPWFSVVGPSVQMPMLSSDFLQKHLELRLAHLALSVMTMGYVWQEGENDTVEVTLCLSFFLFVIITFSFLPSFLHWYQSNIQFI